LVPGARITYIGPVPPFRGGIAQHGARTVQALIDAGRPVEVLSWARQYPKALYPGRERDPAAKPFPGARFLLRWWDPVSWVRAGRRARRGDLMVFPWVTPVQAPAYRVMLASARGAAVAIVHNPLPHERRGFDEALTRLVLAKVRGAVVHSGGAADELRALVPGIHVVSTPMPPLMTVVPEPLPPAPPYRLLFYGFVRPYKGLDVAIDALRILRARGIDATLTVAGEFWHGTDETRRQIAGAGLTGAVTIRAGYLPDDETSSVFAAHHVVVAPYRTATQSAIVPIAFAAGRPVAATLAGGLAEHVLEGVTGAVAQPGDPEAFADAVERVIADLPKLAAGAREHRSSWTDVADAIIEAAG
jgi:glycosyltransferase involved in cell wall biosynthesis